MVTFMRIGAVALLWVSASQRIHASVIITATEANGDVVFSGSGSVELSDLSLNPFAVFGQGGVYPSLPSVQIGPTFGNFVLIDVYEDLTSPGAFGSGDVAFPDSSSGDIFGVSYDSFGSTSTLTVPRGYISGSPLSGSMVYESRSFKSMGIEVGTYLWAWGTGETTDFLRLEVLPEPTSFSIVGLGLVLVLARKRY